MTDWYDGPRRGVAMVDGRPHLYESCWNDIDSNEETLYLLTPISEELLANAIEDWEIWQRWSHAHKMGNASIETHPALPSDRARHAQLAALLKKQLIIDEHCKLVAIAKFRYNADAEPNMEADWVIVDYDQSKDKRDTYRWGIEDDPNNSMDRPFPDGKFTCHRSVIGGVLRKLE